MNATVTTPNIHWPERVPGEDWSDYMLRRQASRLHNRVLKHGAPQLAMTGPTDTSRFFLGQRLSMKRDRKHTLERNAMRRQQRAKAMGLPVGRAQVVEA